MAWSRVTESSERAPVHISSDAATLACVDGPELLVYEGRGAPRWKHFCGELLVDVRAIRDEVVAVDATGQLTRFRPADGRILEQVQLDGALSLDLSADGLAVVRSEASVQLVERGGANRTLPHAGATAVALGPDRGSLGIGFSDGTFRAVDAQTGTAWGEVQLPGPVDAITWSAQGWWLVAAGPQLCAVSGEGTEVVGTVGLQTRVYELAVSADGLIAAAAQGHNQVALAELFTWQPVGSLEFRRSVGGVCFGPGGTLVIGLDDGDATLLEVFTAGSTRTEPHPGRGRNVWNYDNRVDHERLRGAVALARAGTEPIARYVGPPVERNTWLGCLAAVVGTFVLIAGCMGCSGVAWWVWG